MHICSTISAPLWHCNRVELHILTWYRSLGLPLIWPLLPLARRRQDSCPSTPCALARALASAAGASYSAPHAAAAPRLLPPEWLLCLPERLCSAPPPPSGCSALLSPSFSVSLSKKEKKVDGLFCYCMWLYLRAGISPIVPPPQCSYFLPFLGYCSCFWFTTAASIPRYIIFMVS